jgi:hypothetical protein
LSAFIITGSSPDNIKHIVFDLDGVTILNSFLRPLGLTFHSMLNWLKKII